MEAQTPGTSSHGVAPAQRSSLGSNKPPAKKLTISLKKGEQPARLAFESDLRACKEGAGEIWRHTELPPQFQWV